MALLRSDEMPSHRGRCLLAQGTLLLLGIYLLVITNSNTSTVCFVLGAGVLLATSLRFIRRQAAAVHVLVLALLVTAGLTMALGGGEPCFTRLGRDTTLTGRTGIWADVIPMVPNPLVGAGFESFWLSPRVNERLEELIPGLPINEAHNGYIEVYLELGWVGVVLISTHIDRWLSLFGQGFSPRTGAWWPVHSLYFDGAVYGITEAGFRVIGAIWIFLLLSVMEASNIAAGVSVGASQPLDASTDHSLELPARTAPV